MSSYGGYPDLSKVKRVLVIKLRNLGDVLLTTPLFAILKRALRQAEIDAFIRSDSSEILLGNEHISKILLFDLKLKKSFFLKRFFKDLLFFFRIFQKKYDLVINLTEGDRGAWTALFSGAKIRVGVDPGRHFKRFFYTHLIKTAKTPRHQVERNLDGLRKIGIFPSLHKKDLIFNFPLDAQKKVLRLLEQAGIEKGDFILFHPASRWRFKCPDSELFNSLAQKLLSGGQKLVFSSSSEPFEMAMVKEITKGLKGPFLDLSGQLSIKDLGALIAFCKTVFCVDSLPLHLASALKAKCVVLFGPTSDIEWGPWQNPFAEVVANNFSCRPCNLDGCGGSKRSDCLRVLKEEDILKALYRKIGP